MYFLVVGLDSDHDQDDKKSVVSNISMMSYLSRKSRISADTNNLGASYTKGITARQGKVNHHKTLLIRFYMCVSFYEKMTEAFIQLQALAACVTKQNTG